MGGVLLWLGWPVLPFPFLLFAGFVPLLLIENYLAKHPDQFRGWYFFFFTYATFIIWNVATTWWVAYASPVGAVFMIIANALLMSIPWLLFRITKRNAGPGWGYFSLVLYWISFEYIHLNWDISWPWLTLGNGFATFPEWIQWYEYTGVFGGTLWIWLVNLLIFFALAGKSFSTTDKKADRRFVVYALLLISLPIAYSYYSYFTYEEEGESVEIVVLQPNIDPYTEKFIGSENFIPFEKQLERFFDLSAEKITPATSFLVWPETAIDFSFREEKIDREPYYQKIKAFKDQYPQLSLLSGAVTYTVYDDEKEYTPSTRYREEIGNYDVFNTAIFLQNDSVSFFHKSKLVPGVEIMPYPQAIGFVSDLLFDLGGTSGGYGRQTEKTVFIDDSVGIAPSICYESIYGDYMREFVLNGANFIFIITNDGWWWKSSGYKQHLQYATLRAIETRRSIARSANTGISCFINQRGDILQPTEFWTQDVIRGSIKSNDELTFYTLYGDYIARTAIWLSVFVFLAGLVKGKIFKEIIKN